MSGGSDVAMDVVFVLAVHKVVVEPFPIAILHDGAWIEGVPIPHRTNEMDVSFELMEKVGDVTYRSGSDCHHFVDQTAEVVARL